MTEEEKSKIRRLTKKELQKLFGGKGQAPPPPAGQDVPAEDAPPKSRKKGS